MRQRCILVCGAAGLGMLSLTLLVGWWLVDGPTASGPTEWRPLPLTAMDFVLTDHEGNDVGPQTLIGRPTLVFFGFTYCPDVCPTTLADISGWLEEIGNEANGVNVIFISVDPERDTVESMAEYVGYFHPNIRGWTGTDEEIARAAAGFRVTYEKVQTGGREYTMNHTAGVFLFNAAGQFVTMIDYHEPREFAVPKIRRALQQARGQSEN